jgi:hypothetical protein
MLKKVISSNIQRKIEKENYDCGVYGVMPVLIAPNIARIASIPGI